MKMQVNINWLFIISNFILNTEYDTFVDACSHFYSCSAVLLLKRLLIYARYKL